MDGLISGAKLVYKAGSSTGDYHHEMNSENFSNWLDEKSISELKTTECFGLRQCLCTAG